MGKVAGISWNSVYTIACQECIASTSAWSEEVDTMSLGTAGASLLVV
jgi:hypothetical protein